MPAGSLPSHTLAASSESASIGSLLTFAAQLLLKVSCLDSTEQSQKLSHAIHLLSSAAALVPPPASVLTRPQLDVQQLIATTASSKNDAHYKLALLCLVTLPSNAITVLLPGEDAIARFLRQFVAVDAKNITMQSCLYVSRGLALGHTQLRSRTCLTAIGSWLESVQVSEEEQTPAHLLLSALHRHVHCPGVGDTTVILPSLGLFARNVSAAIVDDVKRV